MNIESMSAAWKSHHKYIIAIVIFGLFGVAVLARIFAASTIVGVEAERANTTLTKLSDAQASGNSFLQFGATGADAAKQNLDLILNQSTRNDKFIANMPGRAGTGFWKNNYDESVVPESQINVRDFLGPASEHYVSGQSQSSGATGHFGIFRTECEFSHFAYDDPIVSPGQPGAAHLHMFFGNTHANAYSNDDTISDTGSGTCNGGPLNRTAYWMPAVFDQSGNVRTPEWITIYYKTLTEPVRDLINPYPKNLKIISGNASANSTQTKRLPSGGIYSLVGWDVRHCANSETDWIDKPMNSYGEGGSHGLVFPRCSGGGQVRAVIRFPFCWDGKNIDSPNHNSHMAFPIGDSFFGPRCPKTHPLMLPSIEYRVQFDFTAQDDLSKWFIASDVRPDGNGGFKMAAGGNGSTLHADWWNGWNPDINKRWVDGCSNRTSGTDCGTGKLSYEGPDGLKRLRTLSSPNQGLGRYDDPVYKPEEIIKLCPGKTLTSDIKSVALCKY